MKVKEDIGRIRYAVKLSKYIKGMKAYLFISFFFNLMYKVMPIIANLVISFIISNALRGNKECVRTLFHIVIVLVLLSIFFAYGDMLISHDMAYRILAKLREITYEKIDELSPAAMENKHSGELTNIVLEDIEQLEWFFAHTIAQIIVAILLPITGLILLGKASMWLPLTLFPFIFLMILVPVFHSEKANQQGVQVRYIFAELNTRIVDGIQGIKDIISFGWQSEYFEKYKKTLEDHQNAQLDYALRGGTETRYFQLIIGLGILCGEAVAAILITKKQMDIIYLLPVLSLCSVIFIPLQEVFTMSTNYGLLFGAARRVFELLQMKPAITDLGTMDTKNVLNKGKSKDHVCVEFQDIAFCYPSDDNRTNEPILKNLSFKINTGETVALVGASGSGKTTVARLLQRFWDVDKGEIKINGINIKEIQMNALREIITVVPQEVYLFNLSVIENLRLAKSDATEKEIYNALEYAQATGFIERLPEGYNTILGERGFRLSGGEKQRLSIAQAFLKNSPVLILDEASANLDAETERKINVAVNRLREGRATLVIAHRLSTIQSADRIVVIQDGSIVGVGTFDMLIKECPYFVSLIEGETV